MLQWENIYIYIIYIFFKPNGMRPSDELPLVKELFFVELITVSLVSKGTRPPSEEVLLRSVLGFFFWNTPFPA